MPEPADHIGCPSRGSDADGKVMRSQMQRIELLCTERERILRPFDSTHECMLPACDEADNPIGRDAECRRALDRIEHAEPARGACPEVDDSAACRKRIACPFHGRGNFAEHVVHGSCDLCILRVHHLDKLARAHLVEMHGPGIARFGRKLPEVDRRLLFLCHCPFRSFLLALLSSIQARHPLRCLPLFPALRSS